MFPRQMARSRQTKRRRRRGTQAGTVRPRGRAGARLRSRSDARTTAEQRRQERLKRPPTWRGAISRGAIAAVALFAVLVIVLGASPAQAVALAVFAAILYVPAFHLTDTLLYRYRQRRHERNAAGTDA
jgi:Flp pilus assembly protein TadB